MNVTIEVPATTPMTLCYYRAPSAWAETWAFYAEVFF